MNRGGRQIAAAARGNSARFSAAVLSISRRGTVGALPTAAIGAAHPLHWLWRWPSRCASAVPAQLRQLRHS
jgi:hypothetical protein